MSVCLVDCFFCLQVAEEEAKNLSASPEEDDAEDESMDEAEGSLPSLGKRRSTDTALSGQNPSKRSRPGSLAEVSVCNHQRWCPLSFLPVDLVLCWPSSVTTLGIYY